MTERPIIFSGPMVRAILAGKKTQTRRVIKPQPTFEFPGLVAKGVGEDAGWWKLSPLDKPIKCPYGQPGDVLWVRETFALETNCNVDSNDRYPPPFNDGRPVRWVQDPHWGDHWQQPHYRATDPTPELDVGGDDPGVRWEPSVHMPRWASRLSLPLKSVRVERLQDISDADAWAEGVQAFVDSGPTSGDGTVRGEFAALWDSSNGKTHSWASNPWVWVLEFPQHRAQA